MRFQLYSGASVLPPFLPADPASQAFSSSILASSLPRIQSWFPRCQLLLLPAGLAPLLRPRLSSPGGLLGSPALPQPSHPRGSTRPVRPLQSGSLRLPTRVRVPAAGEEAAAAGPGSPRPPRQPEVGGEKAAGQPLEPLRGQCTRRWATLARSRPRPPPSRRPPPPPGSSPSSSGGAPPAAGEARATAAPAPAPAAGGAAADAADVGCPHSWR